MSRAFDSDKKLDRQVALEKKVSAPVDNQSAADKRQVIITGNMNINKPAGHNLRPAKSTVEKDKAPTINVPAASISNGFNQGAGRGKQFGVNAVPTSRKA